MALNLEDSKGLFLLSEDNHSWHKPAIERGSEALSPGPAHFPVSAHPTFPCLWVPPLGPVPVTCRLTPQPLQMLFSLPQMFFPCF